MSKNIMNIEDSVLQIVKRVTTLKLNLNKEMDQLKRGDYIIIDFYNLYCNIIKFNKYKIFSSKTFVICMDLLMKTLKDYNVIIVSKNIFEVDDSIIASFTKDCPNLLYIIVEDLPKHKGTNKERDDYTCLVLNYQLSKKKSNSFILSNDRFKNLKTIIFSSKPIIWNVYSKGELKKNNICHSIVERKKIAKTVVNRISFDFV